MLDKEIRERKYPPQWSLLATLLEGGGTGFSSLLQSYLRCLTLQLVSGPINVSFLTQTETAPIGDKRLNILQMYNMALAL